MLEVSGLRVRYGRHLALDQVSVRVAPGEIVVILGANGAGKSTLLKAISGICEGEVEGSVRLDGVEISGRAANAIVEEGIALVPEGRGVFGELTVRENLVLGAYSARARENESANLDRVLLLFPKLRERSGQIVRTMSGGEQQMVAIGRAMMSNPQILTLDEPSLGLSPLLCKELFQNLKKVKAMGIGVLLVEQNARQSLAIADRGYLLENARIVHEDSAARLRDDPAVQEAYLGVGGATAPHTHEKAGASPAGAPAEALPPAFELRPRSQQTVSADALLERSISDLVAGASRRASAAVEEKREIVASPAQAAAHADRMQAKLVEIERAAKAARERRRSERPRLALDPAPPSDDRPAPVSNPDPAPPPVIEIYRAPRVEVWRRRPGSGEYDRS